MGNDFAAVSEVIPKDTYTIDDYQITTKHDKTRRMTIILEVYPISREKVVSCVLLMDQWQILRQNYRCKYSWNIVNNVCRISAIVPAKLCVIYSFRHKSYGPSHNIVMTRRTQQKQRNQRAANPLTPLVYDLLQWHHNGRDSVSNHRRLDCLLNRVFRRKL